MSIAIEQLRYIRLGTRDLPQATRFAGDELGLQAVGGITGEAAFRADERDYCLLFADESPKRQAVGLEVRDVAALEAAVAALQARGITARRDDAVAARRRVRALLAFDTPGGISVELVVRPQTHGRRCFLSRDTGVTGLAAAALRSTDVAADEALWTEVFGARVGDWAGDSVYLGFDAVHHRLALHPASRSGVLAVEFEVDGINAVMQQYYRLHELPQAIAHGPGRRPTSEQVFMNFHGPDDMLYGFVAEGRRVEPGQPHRPRQFARQPDSFCQWGSDCHIPELHSGAQPAPVPVLREVPRS